MEVWRLNPQFISGSNGIALGVVIWLNANLILALAAKRLSETGPVRQHVEKELEKLQEETGLGTNLVLDEKKKYLLFGLRPNDPRRRLCRRLVRARKLLDLCRKAGDGVGYIDDLVNAIKSQYDAICHQGI
jgi:hypothetical protein